MLIQKYESSINQSQLWLPDSLGDRAAYKIVLVLSPQFLPVWSHRSIWLRKHLMPHYTARQQQGCQQTAWTIYCILHCLPQISCPMMCHSETLSQRALWAAGYDPHLSSSSSSSSSESPSTSDNSKGCKEVQIVMLSSLCTRHIGIEFNIRSLITAKQLESDRCPVPNKD